ncbi:hypothetical protein [uncultured Marinobacter sp.]|uniref:hypothetical protein n=1 Tax=uncultured Marinobacter sp. TaxID=187379 RepID=UPI0025856450|nr:hypothetical protein [uncultured Marinobacter sp.]
MARKKQARKVRKAHDPRKRIRKIHGNLRTWTWQAQSAIEPPPFTRAENKINGSWISVPRDQQAVLYQQPMNWIVGMRALCRTPAGDEFIESVTLTARDFRLKELNSPRFNFWLLEFLLEDLRSDHIVDVGWLAHTFNGASWETDCARVGAWVSRGLGWLPMESPWRKREWDDIHQDFKAVMKELAA